MKISTWYNTTQEKYLTEYRQFILDHDSGYINNQGHILISTIYFFDNKVFFEREAREKYIYKKIYSAKQRVKRKIINFIKKL